MKALIVLIGFGLVILYAILKIKIEERKDQRIRKEVDSLLEEFENVSNDKESIEAFYTKLYSLPKEIAYYPETKHKIDYMMTYLKGMYDQYGDLKHLHVIIENTFKRCHNKK